MMIEVYVYTHPEGRPEGNPLILAYTRYFTHDACVHSVNAKNGTQAKRLAINDHRLRCLEADRRAAGE